MNLTPMFHKSEETAPWWSDAPHVGIRRAPFSLMLEFFNAFFAATASLMGGNEANHACSGKAHPARMETQAAHRLRREGNGVRWC